jgi:hypothetical protein
MLQNLDDEQADRILENLPDDVIENAMTTAIDKHLIPQAEEVRRLANEEYEDSAEVRAYYESLSEEEKQTEFTQAASQLMGVLTKLREDPLVGGKKLKEYLRDPWTVEAILLILEDEAIPEERIDERKDFACTWLRFVGVNVVPEAYRTEEIDPVIEELYGDVDPSDIYEDLGIDPEEHP